MWWVNTVEFAAVCLLSASSIGLAAMWADGISNDGIGIQIVLVGMVL